MKHSATARPAPDVAALLARHEIKPTQQRLEIAGFLFRQPQHVGADQVLAEVNRIDDKVSKATVYNTLNLFVKKGLIREVLINPERVFYDSNSSAHHHVYNEDTGELSDLDCNAVLVQDLPAVDSQFEVIATDVIVRVRARR